MFQIYLAASPSIWYRERMMLGGMDGFGWRFAPLPPKPLLMLVVDELEHRQQPWHAVGP
jgi:predicted alpha/beta superfamily hydrolase